MKAIEVKAMASPRTVGPKSSFERRARASGGGLGGGPVPIAFDIGDLQSSDLLRWYLCAGKINLGEPTAPVRDGIYSFVSASQEPGAQVTSHPSP